MASTGEIHVFNLDPDCKRWAIQLPDYNERFREDIKSMIPADERTWDATNRQWEFPARWKEWVLNLAQRCFPGVEINESEL